MVTFSLGKDFKISNRTPENIVGVAASLCAGYIDNLKNLCSDADYKEAIKEYNISNIQMKNTETNETMIFWENREIRKHKAGKLITQLSADYEYECENGSLIIFNNDTRMCKKCFEMHYNTTVNSLIVTKQP